MNTVNTQAVQETAVKLGASMRLVVLKTMFNLGRTVGKGKGAYEIGEKLGIAEGKDAIKELKSL